MSRRPALAEPSGPFMLIVPTDAPDAIAAALDTAMLMSEGERQELARRARDYAMQFDRAFVLDRLLCRVEQPRLAEITAA